MNIKKKKEKDLKRGLMTNAERRGIQIKKWEESDKRKQGCKYKKPLWQEIEESLRKKL